MRDAFTKHKTKIIVGALILVVLAGAFLWGGSYPKFGPDAGRAVSTGEPSTAKPTGSSGQTGQSAEAIKETTNLALSGSSDAAQSGSKSYSESHGMTINPDTGKDKYQTNPVPEGKPVPVEPQDAIVTDQAMTCTLSVRCDTILNNMKLLGQEKWELVPKDGIIFAKATVTFYEGESIFDVLRREMKKAHIQMEFENTPMYNSAYIESINNLYEFDVGELSGWMFKVNGWFPNYGCNRYQLKPGDAVEWVYSCDLGKDVGGSNGIRRR